MNQGEINWYFVPDSTPVVTYATPYRSRLYDWKEWPQPDSPGELDGPYSYLGGLPPFPPAVGTRPCGPQDYWENGVPPDAEIPSLWPGTTIPICCPPPKTLPVAIAIGTTTVYDGCCPSGLPTVVVLSFGPPFAGSCPALNDFQLPLVYSNNWGPSPTGNRILFQSSPFEFGTSTAIARWYCGYFNFDIRDAGTNALLAEANSDLSFCVFPVAIIGQFPTAYGFNIPGFPGTSYFIQIG